MLKKISMLILALYLAGCASPGVTDLVASTAFPALSGINDRTGEGTAPVNTEKPPDNASAVLHPQPLPVGSHSPIQLFRASIVPQSPYLLEKGKLRLRAGSTWFNIWGTREYFYIIDGEALNSYAGFAYGLTDGIQVGFSYNSVRIGGGILDSFIERTHDLLGVSDFDRPDYPRDKFIMEFYTLRGEKYLYSSDDRTPKERQNGGSGTLEVRIFEEDKYLPQAALYFNYKHGNMRDDMPEPHKTGDYGFGLLFGKKVGNWNFYLNAAQYHYRENSFGPIRLRSVQRDLFLGAEYCTAPDFSIVMQMLSITKAAISYFEFAKPTNEVIVGIRWAFSKDMVLEAGFLENLFEYFNSPDIGLHVGVSFDF